MNASFETARIALIAGCLGNGGAEKQLYYLVKVLHGQNANIILLSLTKGEFWQKKIEELGVSVIWVGKRRFPLLRLVQILREVIKFSPDIIQSQHFYTNLYSSIVSCLTGAIDIGAVRGNALYELEQNAFWGKALLHFPSWLLANSESAYHNLKNMGRKDNLLVLPNAIDLEEFDVRLAGLDRVKPNQTIRIVTIARLVPVKKIDRLLSIAVVLKEASLKNMEITIVGDGSEKKELENMARKLGLADMVHFMGRRNDIPEILSKSDIFVLTSDKEGFPNVLLEAMAARLPVVTTPAGDAQRIVKHGVTGYLADFDDLTGFAQCIMTLVENSDLREKMGEAGRQRVEEKYSTDALLENTRQIYARVLTE